MVATNALAATLLADSARQRQGFWHWQRLLPLPSPLPRITLHEGGTPLLPSRAFPHHAIYLKDETRNPTGSHKDRALALAAAHAVSLGARTMAVVSAGSTGLSNAAYAAAAGLASVAVMAPGASAERVAPLAALGARVIEVELSIDAAIEALTVLGHADAALYVASTTRAANPVQAEAARTIAYEIVADLRERGETVELVITPVGGGGTLAAMHAGFEQLREARVIERVPRLVGVVPTHYDTLARAFDARVEDAAAFFALPAPRGGRTILNKIAHDHPPDGVAALRALRESGGRVLRFSDAEALAAVSRVGRAEGLYLEPSSAIAWRALEALVADGTVSTRTTTVVLACGSGFRESAVIGAGASPPRRCVAPETLASVLAEPGH